MNSLMYILTDLYEAVFKRNTDIIADTIEKAINEEVYNPDGVSQHGKTSFLCVAIEHLQRKKRITRRARKLSCAFIQKLIYPSITFEGFAQRNVDKFPSIKNLGRITHQEEYQRARIRWARNLVRSLRSDV